MAFGSSASQHSQASLPVILPFSHFGQVEDSTLTCVWTAEMLVSPIVKSRLQHYPFSTAHASRGYTDDDIKTRSAKRRLWYVWGYEIGGIDGANGVTGSWRYV